MGCSNNLIQQGPQIEIIYSKNYHSEKDEEKYPLFQKNFWFDYIQNINKIYIEKLIDNKGNNAIITHKIYLTLNYKDKRMAIIQIDKKRFNDPKLNEFISLKNQVLNGCSFEYLHDYIEKYNEKFQIDSSKLLNINKTTDIIIKVGKTDSGIKGFEMMHDKKESTLNYHKIENPGPNTTYENVFIENLNTLKMIEKYNQLNSKIFSEENEIQADFNSKPREWIPEPGKENKNNSSGGYSDKIKKIKYDDTEAKDENGKIINKFDGEYIKDADGYKMAKVSKDGNIVDEKRGNILKVEENGTVRDARGHYLGKVEKGHVLDNNGNIIGEVEGGTNAQVAYNFF